MALIRHLAWMSRMIYFDGQHTTAGWTRVTTSEAFCGFYAAEFHRRNGTGVDVAICFRGTEFHSGDYNGGMTTPSSAWAMLKDVVADLQLIADSSSQVTAAREYAMQVIQRTVRARTPHSLILTGHSLGASLAQSAVTVCPTNTRVITFCTPLVSLGTLVASRLLDYGKVLNITVKGDPITDKACVGSRLAIGRMLQVDVPYGQPGMDKHDMQNLAEWVSKSNLGVVDVSSDSFDPSKLQAP